MPSSRARAALGVLSKDFGSGPALLLVALGGLLLVLVLHLFWVFAVEGRLRPGSWSRELSSRLHRPSEILLYLGILYFGLDTAAWAGPTYLWTKDILYILLGIWSAVLLQGLVGLSLDLYLNRPLLREGLLSQEFAPLLKGLASVLIYFVVGTVLLEHFGVNIAGLVTAAGVASLSIALAAQETLANMIAAFTIMLDRPFRVGDRIRLPEGDEGVVSEIGLRSTRLLTPENTLLVVPNKLLSSARILNYTQPDPRTKLEVSVNLPPETDPEAARRAATAALKNPHWLTEPTPTVHLSGLGSDGLRLTVTAWLPDQADRSAALDYFYRQLGETLRVEGLGPKA